MCVMKKFILIPSSVYATMTKFNGLNRFNSSFFCCFFLSKYICKHNLHFISNTGCLQGSKVVISSKIWKVVKKVVNSSKI